MKNKIFIIFTFATLLFASNLVVAENISIIAKNVMQSMIKRME